MTTRLFSQPAVPSIRYAQQEPLQTLLQLPLPLPPLRLVLKVPVLPERRRVRALAAPIPSS